MISCVAPARLQLLGIAKNALENLAFAWVDQLIENDLVNLGYGVGPVGMDAEAQHVADDQQRRITEGTRILLKLGERRAQVAVGLFVLPGEMLFLPDIRPTGGSGRFDGPLLEGVPCAGRVRIARYGFVQEMAEVNELALCGSTLGQRACLP